MVSVIVVGGGVMGSAAAWRLARRGAAVTVLEQYGPGHAWGSSHGSARIFRLTYTEDDYVRLGRSALELWHELDPVGGASLVELTGAVDHGPSEIISALHTGLRRVGMAAEMCDRRAAERRWPGLRFDRCVLYHADAGRIHADRAVRALQRAAAALGANVRHRVAVASVHPDAAAGVRVRTRGGEELRADAVVMAAGAWTSGLLGHGASREGPAGPGDLPPLRVTLEQPTHFRPYGPTPAWPSVLHHPGADLPASEYATLVYSLVGEDGVKVGLHGAGPVVDPDPARHDRSPDPLTQRLLRRYVRAWLPGVDPLSAAPGGCLYTLTPDHDFIVDRRGPVTVLAGFSGHGFKFAPVIGEMAAGLTLAGEEAPPRFRLDRSPAPAGAG
jgi:monomeric sarcosine oxidase